MFIEVSQLTKRHGATLSVDGLSFGIPEGSIAGLLGPNGAGKSTTIRMLTGLARPTSGSARIAGLDVQRDHASIRRRLGYLPELAPCYPEMTVGDFLSFMAGTKHLDARESPREVARVASLLNLQPWLGRLLRNLSKGTRQRVGIAQALLGKPSLVILDEPTAGLDPAQIQDVRRLLQSLRGTCTILLSTHILPEVELSCDRVVIINRGRLVAEGPLASLRGGADATGTLTLKVRGDRVALSSAVREALAPALVSERVGDDGIIEFSAPAPAAAAPLAARAAVGAGGDLLALATAEPTLEDIYLRAVTSRAEEN